jgi:hypothetical protein
LKTKKQNTYKKIYVMKNSKEYSSGTGSKTGLINGKASFPAGKILPDHGINFLAEAGQRKWIYLLVRFSAGKNIERSTPMWITSVWQWICTSCLWF